MSNLAYANPNVKSIGINYINEYFEAFLSSKSTNTANNYRIDINTYFQEIFNKEAEHVTIEDIESTKSIHASRFYNYLKHEANNGKGYKNASIKRKVNAVKSFYKFLRVDHQSVNAHIFDNLDLDDETLDRKQYGNLTWKEKDAFLEYALDNKLEGMEMPMLIKLASVTSIRLSALLSLTWEDHFFVKEEKGILVNYIKVTDKSKVNKKPISEDFFKELQKNLGNSGKLFYSLNAHKVGVYINQIVKALGIDERRNIKFHSLKKAGVNEVIIRTKDMQKAKQQGNHSSMITTDNYYIEVTENLTDMASYTLDKEIDVVEEIEDVSKEDLLKAISNISDSAKYEILRALKGL